MSKKPARKEVQNPKENQPKASYEAKDIYVLKGLEPVRRRPGMYIGSTGPDGLHHLIYECVDNSIDEAMAGHAKNITVEFLKDNRVAVTDDGRGIPVDIHPDTKKSALETVMTTLHAGGKFGGESYKVSGGLHGVGVSVVCALSKWMRVEVCRNGGLYMQEYARGKPKAPVKKSGKCARTGTKVIFEADPEIFPKIEFDLKRIEDHLRQQAYLTKGVRIDTSDERGDVPSHYSFYFDGGIRSFVRHLSAGKTVQENVMWSEAKYEDIEVELSFAYANDIEAMEMSFANNIYTPDGGTHLTGFRSALTRTLNDYGKREGYLKGDDSLTGDDVREGLIAVVSVKLREPQFEGQTKAKLGNTEARTAVESVASEALKEFLERFSQDARHIMEKVLLAAKARQAAKAAKDTVLRKGALEGMTLPGKLADCSSRNPEESELFIVEGDSAGGCLGGDTKIALTDGRNVSFRDLIEEFSRGKRNYCYTIKNSGAVGIEEIKNPRMTRRKAAVLKVILDNDEEIICTPDHRFMLRDGTYKTAGDLKSNDSLMPLYRQHSRIGKRITIQGYELVFSPNENRWIFTHLLADNFNIENGVYKDDERIISLSETVTNYNHKVKKIIPLEDKMDVYDIEVPKTHNFALASGVFVHNSSKQGRDRRTQAILPLRGKILNVEKSRLDKMLVNKEIRALIVALGTAMAENFNIEKLRYHKVVLMTDADTDGAHIRTLLLTLFYRHFPKIIDGGYLYIAQPPLYKVQKGKALHYSYKEEEKDKLVKSLGEGGINIQRYKGLGEMNASELWETTMDPEKRVLKKVEVADAAEADRLFDILMGGEVEPRKNFIQVHAKTVKNLDI